MNLPLRPIFRQSHPNFINVRTAYASKIWAQLTKNLLAKSSTKRFQEYILTVRRKKCQFLILCTLETFPALAFAADFPPVAPKFHQRTPRVRLRNLGTTDKKSSRKIKYKKVPRVHGLKRKK